MKIMNIQWISFIMSGEIGFKQIKQTNDEFTLEEIYN